ncbi:MAG: class III signal peptide-containing protein [Candidatus Diapherotrites archaeon]|nr:class III signal peptide-containing protein [Candidatus Diapherotrites archaeon]
MRKNKLLQMVKAQGALEYLLLLGGAILVAVIAIAVIILITASTEGETNIVFIDALCAKYPENDCFRVIELKNQTFGCHWLDNRCSVVKFRPITSCGFSAWEEGSGSINFGYYLANDLATAPGQTCLTIDKDKVFLACYFLPYKITVASGGTGIKIAGTAKNVKVRSCKLTLLDGANAGIEVSGGGSNPILLNEIINNSFIFGNSFTGTGQHAIYVTGTAFDNSISINNACSATTTQEAIKIDSTLAQYGITSNKCKAVPSGFPNSTTSCSDPFGTVCPCELCT